MCMLYTLVAVNVKYAFFRIAQVYTHRPRVEIIGGHKCVITFYQGMTEMRVIVSRKTGPPSFYMATDEFGNDVTSKVVPYAHCVFVPPTPAELGFTRIDAWDMFDDRIEFKENDTISL